MRIISLRSFYTAPSSPTKPSGHLACYFPHYLQYSVKTLLAELKIDSFSNLFQGDYIYQAGPNSPIQSERYQEEIPSNRVVGGMGDDDCITEYPASRAYFIKLP